MKTYFFKRLNIYVLTALMFSLFLVQTSIAAEYRPVQEDLSNWDLDGFKPRSKWKIGLAEMDSNDNEKLIYTKDLSSGQLVNIEKGTTDIFTKKKFGDCVVELEFMIPEDSNSGIYLMGQYEVQVKDSFGDWFIGDGDMGAIFETSEPKTNAAKKPGEWQKIHIDFKAPKFENGKKVAPAEFVKVVLNGQVIQENVKMDGSTGGSLVDNKEFAEGPLMFQGGLGPVAYRNIKIVYNE